jgi:adenine-specific DNA-methyltransferase
MIKGVGLLYETLVETLKKENNYVSDNGELKKWVVCEEARQYSTSLLSLLLSNEVLSKAFFVDVQGTKVFLREKFLAFLEQKAYLSDSYSAFSTKVGLQINGRFLNQQDSVELVFPYKDCILEGGQTKEQQKRSEIFFNQILAQDEITQLLEPKVLTGACLYSTSGKAKANNINRDIEKNKKRSLLENTITDNLVIKGNNLISLYSMLNEFRGRVQLIYIDPPYYFKNNPSTDTFKYNSNFHLSTWLVFMRDRLKVAKQLLKKGGTIWISMGDDGMHYLKVIADEIFGADHFVGTLPRRTRTGKSDVPYNLSQDFDWLLVYTNVDDSVDVLGRSVERKYFTTDDFPGEPWRLADLTSQQPAGKRPNSYFTMVDPKTGNEYPADEKRTWAVTKDTFQQYYDNGYIVFPGDYDFLRITKPYARKFKSEDDANGSFSSVFSDIQIEGFLRSLLNDCKNKKGNDEIEKLFGRDEFDYAKPENLIKTILSVATSEGDIVLDFFSGSGTTAAVAHKMKRQYIVCEQIDHQVDLTLNRLCQVIAGDNVGISEDEDINWKGGGSFVYLELKNYNNSFIEQIQKAKKTEKLLSVWKEMKKRAFFRFNIDLIKFDEGIEEFKALPLDQQKQVLCDILDMNQLYVNLSDIDDETVGVTEQEKIITKSFYGEA